MPPSAGVEAIEVLGGSDSDTVGDIVGERGSVDEAAVESLDDCGVR